MNDPLIELFGEVLGVTPGSLSDATAPENTPEWDSLKAMELVTELEDRFQVRFSTREIMKMRTIGVVREVLAGKGVPIGGDAA